jgi:hypothetical protein
MNAQNALGDPVPPPPVSESATISADVFEGDGADALHLSLDGTEISE